VLFTGIIYASTFSHEISVKCKYRIFTFYNILISCEIAIPVKSIKDVGIGKGGTELVEILQILFILFFRNPDKWLLTCSRVIPLLIVSKCTLLCFVHYNIIIINIAKKVLK
jgi:hypothetical protein